MKKLPLLVASLFLVFHSASVFAQDKQNLSTLANKAERSLEKGITFMKSLAIEGGYVYHYSMDGKEKWGEGKTDDRTIEVQPPGTPAVGMSFLRAFRIAKNKDFLFAAEDAASALIKGQNELGGWIIKSILIVQKEKK